MYSWYRFFFFAIFVSFIKSLFYILFFKENHFYIINIIGILFLICLFFLIKMKIKKYFYDVVIMQIKTDFLMQYEYSIKTNKKKIITYFSLSFLMLLTPYEFVLNLYNIESFFGIWVITLAVTYSTIILIFHLFLQCLFSFWIKN